MYSRKHLYTVITPERLWEEYSDEPGIYRCGRGSHPALKKLRFNKDLHCGIDPFVDDPLILPNPAMGISFADSIQTLKRQPVNGVAWLLPSGRQLPKGLVFNYKDKYHPLLNVEVPMPASEFKRLLDQLAKLMECTKIKV